MTPQIIGELLDCCSDGNYATIIASGLSLMIGDDVRCETSIDNTHCDLFVYGNLLERSEELAKLVMQIPTLDDNGEYGSQFWFRECCVYVIMTRLTRSS
jgi:hypothetical protein